MDRTHVRLRAYFVESLKKAKKKVARKRTEKKNRTVRSERNTERMGERGVRKKAAGTRSKRITQTADHNFLRRGILAQDFVRLWITPRFDAGIAISCLSTASRKSWICPRFASFLTIPFLKNRCRTFFDSFRIMVSLKSRRRSLIIYRLSNKSFS